MSQEDAFWIPNESQVRALIGSLVEITVSMGVNPVERYWRWASEVGLNVIGTIPQFEAGSYARRATATFIGEIAQVTSNPWRPSYGGGPGGLPAMHISQYFNPPAAWEMVVNIPRFFFNTDRDPGQEVYVRYVGDEDVVGIRPISIPALHPTMEPPGQIRARGRAPGGRGGRGFREAGWERRGRGGRGNSYRRYRPY
jgi:hypothetical protein